MAEQAATENQPVEQYESPFKNIRYEENPYFPAQGSEPEEEAPVAEEAAEAEEASPEDAQSEETSFLPEGEEVDVNSPEYKKLFAAYTKARQRDSEELKKAKADLEARLAALEAGTTTKPAGQEEASNTATQEIETDPYTVSFEGFTPEVKIPEDSELSGLEAPLAELMNAVVPQYISHVMGQLRQRNEVAEQQTRAMTAREKVESYITEAQLHPDYEAKVPAIAEMAKNPAIQKLAVEDPDTFIALVEAKTGIHRGWQASIEEDDAPAPRVPQRAPANKARAATPRATPRSPVSTPVGDGYYNIDDAIDKALSGKR